MCLGGGGQAPDPVATAQAQNAVNKDALFTAAQLNQINQTGPLGSISYTGGVGSPDRTQVTSLSPELQKLLGGQLDSSQSLTDLANQRLAGAPGGNFDLGTNPVGYLDPRVVSPLQTSVNTTANGFVTNVGAAPIKYGFDSGGQTQRSLDFSGAPSLNTDFSGLAKQAQDANYASQTQYLDPQFAQSEQAMRSRLAAQGITQGSDAYNQEMDNFNRSKQAAYSDARNQAIGQGNAQANALFGQNLAARQQGVGEATTQGNFANSALAQQFAQNQGQASFYNAAQAQGFGQGMENAQLNNQAMNDAFGQNLSAADFGNQALGQQFNRGLQVYDFNNQLYNQGLQNQILGRNQNINEAMAYLNGTPISGQTMPQYQPISQSTAAQGSPDLMSLTANNYNAQRQASASLLGSIFGGIGKIGGAAIGNWG